MTSKNSSWYSCTALLALGLSAAALSAQGADAYCVPIPPAAQILQRLQPGHPRLLLSTAECATLKARVASEPQLREWHTDLLADAQRILTQAPSKYEIPDGLRLLATSRRVLERVRLLALLHRLAGDQRYAQRAWKELEAAAAFKDWNPKHFLDTAEMTHAFAIGYDWLYDYWTPEQRTTLRQAMIEKGLKPALNVVNGEIRGGWWSKATHNWNQVCNGGIGAGALALADVEPALAGRFLEASLKSLQLALRSYGPDGAWNEGPGYWTYASDYTVLYLAALNSALGTDFGLSGFPGFDQTALFPLYVCGTTGLSFSFADCHAGRMHAPELFWLARRFEQPVAAWMEQRVRNPGALDLVWYDAKAVSPQAAGLSLDKYYRGVEVTTFRGAWQEPNATFFGFKAGDNKANHSHLDLGTFVLDALGERWAEDLGSDDYNMPGYFGGKRWDYYRLRAEGHNTLVINPGKGPDQDPKAAARMLRFESKPDAALAIADLTPAYAAEVQRVERGLRLIGRKSVLVEDEVTAKQPADVWWFLHTAAQIRVSQDGRTAELQIGAKRLNARLLSPAGASFTVLAAQPLPTSPAASQQARNKGTSKLTVHLADVTELRLAVLLEPVTGEIPSVPVASVGVVPLRDW
jgi:hypothetical protein